MKDNPAASPIHAACFKSKLNFKLKILILSQLESALPVPLRLLQPSSCRWSTRMSEMVTIQYYAGSSSAESTTGRADDRYW